MLRLTRSLFPSFLLAALFSVGAAQATPQNPPGPGEGHDHDCPGCQEKTKTICMNLVCEYEFRSGDHENHCTVASTFMKKVTEDGGEVSDYSGHDDDVRFEMKCGGITEWKGAARRSTDLLGTRIQSEQGPTPAIELPRGELHSNEEGHGAGHWSSSVLEMNLDQEFKRAHGKCFIWSGAP